MRFWHWLQCRVNERAQKATGGKYGGHWLWAVNSWLCDRWWPAWQRQQFDKDGRFK